MSNTTVFSFYYIDYSRSLSAFTEFKKTHLCSSYPHTPMESKIRNSYSSKYSDPEYGFIIYC